MKLTKEQIEYVNTEKKSLERIIASEPKYGMFRYVAKQEALQLIIELHNIACAAERKEKEALEARVEKVKEKVSKTFGNRDRKDTQTNV